MKYIKTYEGFFSKIKGMIKDYRDNSKETSGEFKLYIDMIDYTEFDTNISNALFMLHQRSILLIGRLEKLLRLQTMEDRKKLIDNIKDFDVISDIYNKNPFDMIRMNDLFDFYNIKFDEEYATKALFQ